MRNDFSFLPNNILLTLDKKINKKFKVYFILKKIFFFFSILENVFCSFWELWFLSRFTFRISMKCPCGVSLQIQEISRINSFVPSVSTSGYVLHTVILSGSEGVKFINIIENIYGKSVHKGNIKYIYFLTSMLYIIIILKQKRVYILLE